MGLLLRLTHICPLWDKVHLGGGSIRLAVAPAGQERPLYLDGYAFVGLPCFCHRRLQGPAAMGKELGLTRPKRLLAASLFLSMGKHGIWASFLYLCLSLSSYILICCPTISNSSGFIWWQHWPFLYLTLQISTTEFSDSGNIPISISRSQYLINSANPLHGCPWVGLSYPVPFRGCGDCLLCSCG